MNYENLTGLAVLALGVLLTLAFQAHQKALKAVKEAKEAVANADALFDLIRKQHSTLTGQLKAQMDVFASDFDKRLQKLEMRIDDVNTRVAQLQIKR